jgi:TetR/AcrR family transcriptional regulator, fatty acid metabolism regulator protein
MEQTTTETTHRSLKERQRQEREELILSVAEEVLMEKGYYEASIDEIAARVGIAKGTVYLHFPGKEDLMVAIVLRQLQEVTGKIDEIIDTDTSAHAKVEAILNCLYGGTLNRPMQCLNKLYNSSDTLRQWKEHGQKLREATDHLAERISVVLEQGKAAGEFAADVPTPVMLNVLFSLLSPRSYERLVVEGKMGGNELVKSLGRIFFKGITVWEKGSK